MAIKKYTNGSWVSASYRKYGTETDAITTLPATVIGDGTPISSYVIKGNMEQTGTPTPSSPIYPSECGDLVASGEHAGQYKLPLTLGNTTTNIYLGEVQSTRMVKKLVLTGEEDWTRTANERCYYINSEKGCPAGYLKSKTVTVICSHYVGQTNTGSGSNEVNEGCVCFFIGGGNELYIGEITITSATDFKAYLAQQYANGTPVTIWYVLASPTTGIVNEPIRKIGDYVDSVSGTNLATSGTAQEFDVETTLKPSELDLTYHGWHEHGDTKYST